MKGGKGNIIQISSKIKEGKAQVDGREVNKLNWVAYNHVKITLYKSCNYQYLSIYHLHFDDVFSPQTLSLTFKIQPTCATY